ncbi:hypothetical protein MRB53_004927 [Persea americana]|uniref:Uncharacterized protein n=1 Tax=Persea americana TaxID=3435 RepID=A0ACC2MBS3_PERAE|nr:hypothetical protein MRB53_004927 [Persea americana]
MKKEKGRNLIQEITTAATEEKKESPAGSSKSDLDRGGPQKYPDRRIYPCPASLKRGPSDATVGVFSITRQCARLSDGVFHTGLLK